MMPPYVQRPGSVPLLHKILAQRSVSVAFILTTMLVLAPVCSAELFGCKTPLTFSQHRLPAILEIENTCNSTAVAMCLEFDGVAYLIQDMTAKQLYSVPSVLEDCWIFRAGSCQGETLLEHSVTGTKKLTVSCTAEENDANAAAMANSVSLDCSLTTVPDLATVFDASWANVPSDLKSSVADELFDPLNEPMQFVNKEGLLRGIFRACVSLARHGVQVDKAMSVFKHLRAVLWHTESCRRELVGATIGFANSYAAVYGSVFAALHGESEDAGTWIDDPPELTFPQNVSLLALTNFAVSIDVDADLPISAYPTEAEGVPTAATTISIRLAQRSKAMTPTPVAAVRQAQSPSPSPSRSANALSGQSLCNVQGPRRWKYIKISKAGEVDSPMDCCSPGCSRLAALTHINVQSFITSCCLACNMGWCHKTPPPRTRAVFLDSEIMYPTDSTTTMKPPCVVMI